LKSIGIIEIDSTVRGLRFAWEALSGGDIELVNIRCADPDCFIAVFRGKRAELITVMDAFFVKDECGSLTKTVLPAPSENLIEMISKGSSTIDIEYLGLVGTRGFGTLVKCLDLSLKGPGVDVVNVRFHNSSAKGILSLSGSEEILHSLFAVMKGLCGILDIAEMEVIKAPSEEMMKALT